MANLIPRIPGAENRCIRFPVATRRRRRRRFATSRRGAVKRGVPNGQKPTPCFQAGGGRLGAEGRKRLFSMADEGTAEGRAFNDVAMQAYGVQKDLYVRQRLFDMKTQYASDLSSFDAPGEKRHRHDDRRKCERYSVDGCGTATTLGVSCLAISRQIAETVARQQSARQKADILALTRQTHLEMDEARQDFLSGDPNRATQAFLSAMQNWPEIFDHRRPERLDGLPLFSPAEKEKARIARL